MQLENEMKTPNSLSLW